MCLPLTSSHSERVRFPRIWNYSRVDDLPFPPGDLDNGAGIILPPFDLAAGDRFETAINKCRMDPKIVYLIAVSVSVISRRYNKEIDITPLVRLSCGLGTKNHTEGDGCSILAHGRKETAD